MSWFQKLLPEAIKTKTDDKGSIPEGVWQKCPACEAILYRKDLEKTLCVCPKCDHHMRINARKRLDYLLDDNEATQLEIGNNIEPIDILKFKDSKRYRDRITAAQKSTNETDALIVKAGEIHGMPVTVAVFEFTFLGGSMGSVVGERFVRAVNHSLENNIPFICFTASGGARMQESLFSLMQMAKTSAALAKLSEAKIPYISVMTDPTTGGVSASLAMLGDLNLAEPKALIGFAGQRVIEQTVRETLPEGFQRSEFLLDHGVVDQIIDRREMKAHLHKVLAMLTRQKPAANIAQQEDAISADNPPNNEAESSAQ